MKTEEQTMALSPRARVIHYLRKAFVDGVFSSGDRLPSEQELCRVIQVSRTTVRAALQELEKERFLRSEGRRRFIAASGNTGRKASLFTETVAILDDQSYPEDEASCWGEWEVFYHLSREAVRRNCHIFSFKTADFTSAKAEQLVRERPLGVVLLHQFGAPSEAIRRLLDDCRAIGIPLVRYESEVPECSGADVVASDHRQGSARLTRWLIGQGRRRILRYWRLNSQSAERPDWLVRRNQGYEEAIREAGLELLPAIEYNHFDQNRPPIQSDFDCLVYEAMGRLHEYQMRHGPVDAIVCASDGVTFSISAACRKLGFEPNRDIWIAGYDNNYYNCPDRLFETTLPLVTVDKNNRQLGLSLFDQLMRRREYGPEKPVQHLLLPTELVFPRPNPPPETASVSAALRNA